ncbi:MAG: TIGR04211 family SH3 domain-containing protein [Chromatiales bacterium]|nr:TIGR04211 family SH3 domain-containing protein [Chromatiales bacterium]
MSAHSETRYVTDELNLSLYELINSKGKLLKRLKSGTELELLSEEGFFAEVRTKDGTVGWTKAGFLIKSKPARALVIELTAENNELKESLRVKGQQLSETEKLLNNLKSQEQQANTELQDQLENTEGIVAALDRIQQENESLRAQQGHYGSVVPVKWGLIASGITFILGTIAGIALFDYRSRRRHGGFRIY